MQLIKRKFEKMALTRTPDLHRSISINSVHANGRSLYIVDRRMVVVEGGCPTPRKNSTGN